LKIVELAYIISFKRWINTLLLAEKKKIMEKSEIETLIQELNNLSEFEKQNIARMKEIAKVLVAYYM
jgi:hypothetical protein